MRAQASDVTAAILIWLPVGARPKSGDFRRSPSAEVLSSFAEAVERAVNDGHPHSGRLPWIKVGSRIAGFTTGSPWLPLHPDYELRNVAAWGTFYVTRTVQER